MIEEIKKEINKYYPSPNYDNKITKNHLFQILDKYNNQQDLKIRSLERAIKKMLNGEELGTGLINTLFGYGLISSEIPSNNQPDYKSAWKELKNTTIFTESYPREHKMNEYYKDVFGELEQKYNLGTNNKEGD